MEHICFAAVLFCHHGGVGRLAFLHVDVDAAGDGLGQLPQEDGTAHVLVHHLGDHAQIVGVSDYLGWEA